MQTIPIDTGRHPVPSELTPEEQRTRAMQYRQMAETARTADVREALLRLAERYEELADGAAD